MEKQASTHINKKRKNLGKNKSFNGKPCCVSWLRKGGRENCNGRNYLFLEIFSCKYIDINERSQYYCEESIKVFISTYELLEISQKKRLRN